MQGFRSSCLQIDVPKDFAIFIGQRHRWSLFRIRLRVFRPPDFNKNRHSFFPVNIAKFLRTVLFMEHLWWLLLNFESSGCCFQFTSPNRIHKQIVDKHRQKNLTNVRRNLWRTTFFRKVINKKISVKQIL